MFDLRTIAIVFALQIEVNRQCRVDNGCKIMEMQQIGCCLGRRVLDEDSRCGRITQRESASLTRMKSLVQSQLRPLQNPLILLVNRGVFCFLVLRKLAQGTTKGTTAKSRQVGWKRGNVAWLSKMALFWEFFGRLAEVDFEEVKGGLIGKGIE